MSRVLVYGAGAIGLYLAVRMKQAGHDVAIRARGAITGLAQPPVLSLRRGGDIEQVADIEVLPGLGDNCRFDVVVIATKAWQVEAAALDVAGSVAVNGRVVTTQNGVEAAEMVSRHISSEKVIAGSIVVVASRTAPGQVEVFGDDAVLTIWTLNVRPFVASDRQVLELFASSVITTRWSEDIWSVLWRKLALVASCGGVGALSGATIGESRGVRLTADLTLGAMREVIGVAIAKGVDLNDSDLEHLTEFYHSGFPADARTSLQKDLFEGRPSELFDLHGAIIKHGAQVGVPTPTNFMIFASQLPREMSARGGVEFEAALSEVTRHLGRRG